MSHSFYYNLKYINFVCWMKTAKTEGPDYRGPRWRDTESVRVMTYNLECFVSEPLEGWECLQGHQTDQLGHTRSPGVRWEGVRGGRQHWLRLCLRWSRHRTSVFTFQGVVQLHEMVQYGTVSFLTGKWGGSYVRSPRPSTPTPGPAAGSSSPGTSTATTAGRRANLSGQANREGESELFVPGDWISIIIW